MKPGFDLTHLAKLANLTPTESLKQKLTHQFIDTLKVVDQLKQLDTGGIVPTPQVTGKTNQLRDDVIDQTRILTQQEALHNAPRTHEGYFVVKRILNQP